MKEHCCLWTALVRTSLVNVSLALYTMAVVCNLKDDRVVSEANKVMSNLPQ